MKNIVLIAIAFLTLNATAQEHKKDKKRARAEMMKDYTAEEQATLQTKKMTLALDLSEAQQKDIYALNLANAKERKAKMKEREAKKGEKPSKEERYKMQNEMLDKKIAMKKKMKQILNDEQFAKWEKMMQRRKSKIAKRKHNPRKE